MKSKFLILANSITGEIDPVLLKCKRNQVAAYHTECNEGVWILLGKTPPGHSREPDFLYQC